MRNLKHLRLDDWPREDLEAFGVAFEAGDLFDGTGGPGAHLSGPTRTIIETGYRRWLGFLRDQSPSLLLEPPTERITPERVRAFVDQLSAELRPTSVAMAVANLCYAARMIAPADDWRWLAAIKVRLAARAQPEDHLGRLVPAWQTLDFGLELMGEALRLPISGHKQRELQYRDGLLLALLSLWPIRRRSIAALTISHHLEVDHSGINLLLHPEDTKAKRAESFRVPEQLVPYLLRYLKEIRPRLLGRSMHDGLWASYRGGTLIAGRIYDIVRARIYSKFGKAMGLHDFRRAGATFLAMDAPDKIGLVPGILQHASPEVGERHYNLARSVQASQRFTAHLSKIRLKLRSVSPRNEG